ncbi:MAG: hypothetical protein AAF487_05825, partial [Bacteroidota bacterium]
KYIALSIIVLCSVSFYGQEFPKVYKKLNKNKKAVYLSKLKAHAQLEKKPNSLEILAVALKYDYRLTESQFKFEELRNSQKLSDAGIIEYAGLLIKTQNYSKSIAILDEFKGDKALLKKANYLKSIASKLLNQKCIEYKSGTETLSHYCYSFDAQMSVNPIQPEIVYTWNFDSRDILEGTAVDYCFDISGTHVIKLGSYDAKNNIVNADSTFTLSILPPLDFASMKTNNIINKEISFRYLENLGEGKDILWHFGNGIFKIGKEANYYFNRPGNYFIEYFIIDTEAEMSSLKCNSCQLFINQNKAEQKSNR